MKRVSLVNRNIMLLDVPEPQITSPYDVKVRIAYASICGYEMLSYHSIVTDTSFSALGHEASGIVVEVGKKVKNLHVNDRVTLSPYSFCGKCIQCQKGNFSYCEHSKKGASSFMSEYVVLNQGEVFRLPDKIQLREGCLIEPLSVTIRAIEKAKLNYGKKLLIIGGGAMGLLLLQVALLHPLDSVVVVERHENKRKIALSLGAKKVFSSINSDSISSLLDFTEALGFDAIIEASGDSSIVPISFNLLSRGGSLVLLSMYNVDYQFPVDVLNLYWKDATIQAVYPPFNYFPYGLSVAQKIDLSAVITGVFPYTQAADAFAAKANHSHAKVILDFTAH